MIRIKLKKDLIEIKGHANQNNYGNDIVCASVSTAMYMTLNQIDLFNLSDHINYEIKDGFAKINIIKENDYLVKIINNFTFTLNDLAKQYPNYIKIEN